MITQAKLPLPTTTLPSKPFYIPYRVSDTLAVNLIRFGSFEALLVDSYRAQSQKRADIHHRPSLRITAYTYLGCERTVQYLLWTHISLSTCNTQS